MLRSAVIAVAVASRAAAGTIDDGVPDARYLAYAEGFRPYTVRLEARNKEGRLHVATATLIADRWALTAAHVVHECTEVVLVSGTERFEVDEVVIHDEWKDVSGEFDIAMLHSERNFGLSSFPPLATRRHNEGSVVSVVGYGITGPMTQGHVLSDGRLRAGTQTIERYEGHMVVCHAKRRSSQMELCIAPGDSGGPLFCDGELAGVHSLTMKDKGPLASREGEESGHTSVFEFVPWINEVMERAR
jgi:myeloblastin